jgi:hypothetical protein
MKGLARGVWLLSVISIMTLAAPVRGDLTPVRVTKADCCAHMVTHHGHCGSAPAETPSSSEQPCCSSCAFSLPLINVPPVAYIFDRSKDEEFVTLLVNQTSRSSRPPVPPPRV